jgi:phosphatidylglycerophosphate synthase
MPNATSSPASLAKPGLPNIPGKEEGRHGVRQLGINRAVNRPLAGLLVRALYATRVTPNQVTLAAFVIGLAGALFFLGGRPWAFAVGGVLVQLSSIVDCADGMLARARGQTSEFGATLDLLLDRLNEFFLMIACALGYFFYSRKGWLLGLGLAGTALYFLETTVFYLLNGARGLARRGETSEERGWLMFGLFFFGLTGRIDIAILVLPFFAAATVAFMVVDFCRRPEKTIGAARPPES